jgi:hypothetical protein
MAWVLTRGLKTVRAEFDAVFPGRDKSTDGSVGDLAHQGSASGHNPDLTGRAEYRDGDRLDEVRAIDVDRDLVPGSGTDWMERVVQHIVQRARAGTYVPFRYIIYRSRIWHRSYGWSARVYTGSNKHEAHAHFSGDWSERGDEWTGSLGLAGLKGAGGGAGNGGEVLVKQGDEGQNVKFWQYVLSSIGYPVGDIDGIYGPKMNAAVNAYRTKFAAAGSGTATMITGWQGWHMLAAMMSKYAGVNGAPGLPGKDGTPGKDGAPGRDGRDGVFTGTLNITGGTLSATAPQQEV